MINADYSAIEMRLLAHALDETYTVTHSGDGREYTFFTSAMARYATKHNAPIVDVTISDEAIEAILKGDTIEPAKLRNVTIFDDRPVTVVIWPDGESHSLVDGNHRVIRRYMNGIRQVRAWVWNHPGWEQFSIVDPDIDKLYAKIMELEKLR